MVRMIAMVALILAGVAQAAVALPELGDSASALLGQPQQRALGRALYLRLQQSNRLLEDPQVELYMQRLGERLLAAKGGRAAFDYRFFVVDSDQINAFAILGGFIGFHSRLILASDNESELASVMAHELTHISQNHLLRAAERSQRDQLPITAAILAAILLGESHPEGAQAVITSALASGEQNQLSYSRLHEHEADRIGIEMLQQAGFDPGAMASFFGKLQNASRFYAAAPEFLSTHPITEQRIGDALNRAALYPAVEVADSRAYAATRARVSVLTHKALPQRLRELEALAQPTLWQRYEQALAYLQLQQPQLARQLLYSMLDAAAEVPEWMLLLAEAEAAMGESLLARQRYSELLQLYPESWSIRYSAARFELQQQQLQQARELLQPLLHQRLLPQRLYRLLARIEAADGRPGQMYLARAQAALAAEERQLALRELIHAKEAAGENFYLQSRIEAYLQQLELSQRGEPTGSAARGGDRSDTTD
ncbi:hypothetical protein D5085_09285 [Ectothiorhodospiraceae bacterium BW-2]|nr:hypothetical protein D5085_09285 [Ectothiorhodospiraceae bacterium BW-2]